MECRYCTAASRAHASGSGGNCWTQKCAMPVWTPAPACSLSHYSRHKPSVKLRICHQRVQPWYCVSRTRLSALAAAPESAAGRIEGVETPSGATQRLPFIVASLCCLHSFAISLTLLHSSSCCTGEVISLGGPGSSLDLQLPRRRLQVSFTCNKCGKHDGCSLLLAKVWEHSPTPCNAAICHLSDMLAGCTTAMGSLSISYCLTMQEMQLSHFLTRRLLHLWSLCTSFAAGGRTERLVNPHAWNKGTVFVQCGQCDVWHNIRDEAGLIDEMGPNSQKASNNEQSASLAGCDEHSS